MCLILHWQSIRENSYMFGTEYQMQTCMLPIKACCQF